MKKVKCVLRSAGIEWEGEESERFLEGKITISEIGEGRIYENFFYQIADEVINAYYGYFIKDVAAFLKKFDLEEQFPKKKRDELANLKIFGTSSSSFCFLAKEDSLGEYEKLRFAKTDDFLSDLVVAAVEEKTQRMKEYLETNRKKIEEKNIDEFLKIYGLKLVEKEDSSGEETTYLLDETLPFYLWHTKKEMKITNKEKILKLFESDKMSEIKQLPEQIEDLVLGEWSCGFEINRDAKNLLMEEIIEKGNWKKDNYQGKELFESLVGEEMELLKMIDVFSPKESKARLKKIMGDKFPPVSINIIGQKANKFKKKLEFHMLREKIEWYEKAKKETHKIFERREVNEK